MYIFEYLQAHVNSMYRQFCRSKRKNIISIIISRAKQKRWLVVFPSPVSSTCGIIYKIGVEKKCIYNSDISIKSREHPM